MVFIGFPFGLPASSRSAGKMLSEHQITELLKARPISARAPWCEDNDELVESFYQDAVAEIERKAKLKSRVEYHPGSGFASFINGWFYDDSYAGKGRVRGSIECAGVSVVLSRFAPYYVLGESVEWRSRGCRSCCSPSLNLVDRFEHLHVRVFGQTIETILEERGLLRLSRSDLQRPIAEHHDVPTILSSPPWTEFDALFYFED